MSDLQHDPVESEAVLDAEAVDAEAIDALPVLAEVRTIERTQPSVIPAVQAAAVAATGFVAGAATIALLRRHGMRKLAAREALDLRGMRDAYRQPFDRLEPGSTRTYLVNVRVVSRPWE
jgi:hypothetical protein